MKTLYKSQFDRIKTFLKQYEYLHDREFIKKYPDSYPVEIQPWIEELRNWGLRDISTLESNPHEDLVLNSSFKHFIKTIRDLTELSESEKNELTLPNELRKNLNPKKIHEIEKIKGLVGNISDLSTIIDIGGGVGHLSCSLVYGSNLKSICVDMNEELQISGKKRVTQILKNEDSIDFVKALFDRNTILNKTFCVDHTVLLGLHSCGDLSPSILRFGVENNIGHVLSFGCCYHKIENELNMSKYSKKDEYKLSKSALHLASRCGGIVDESNLMKRLRQKQFRYTLHYLVHSINNSSFKSIGNALPADYLNFYDYCMKFDHQKILTSLNEDEVNQFYEESTEKVWDHYLADTIRLLLGRVIEVYIALDRAIYLEENNYSVVVEGLFDRALSPRNIMLRATPL